MTDMDEHAFRIDQLSHEPHLQIEHRVDPYQKADAEAVIGIDAETEPEPEPGPESMPEVGQPEIKASSVHGNRYPLALRIQCLTLTSEGYRVDDIAAKLGMSRKTIYYIKKRAKDRGFDPDKDPRILESYVIDGARPGRPRKIPKPPVDETVMDGSLIGALQDNTQALQAQDTHMIDMHLQTS